MNDSRDVDNVNQAGESLLDNSAFTFLYAKIPEAMLFGGRGIPGQIDSYFDLPTVTPVEAFVFGGLARHGDNIFPSNSRLAVLLGLSTRTIQRAIAALLEKGWITVQVRTRKGQQTSNLYTLRTHPVPLVQAPSEDHWGDTGGVPRGDTGGVPRGDTGGVRTRVKKRKQRNESNGSSPDPTQRRDPTQRELNGREIPQLALGTASLKKREEKRSTVGEPSTSEERPTVGATVSYAEKELCSAAAGEWRVKGDRGKVLHAPPTPKFLRRLVSACGGDRQWVQDSIERHRLWYQHKIATDGRKCWTLAHVESYLEGKILEDYKKRPAAYDPNAPLPGLGRVGES